MTAKPFCPNCGEPMSEADESDAHFHSGAYVCDHCRYSTDCPPDDEQPAMDFLPNESGDAS